MRAFTVAVGLIVVVGSACSGGDATPDGTATPTTARATSTATPTMTSTASPAGTVTVTAPAEPPGTGLFKALAYFGNPVDGGPTASTDTGGLYLANGETVIALEPAAGAAFELNGIPSPDGNFVMNGGDLGLTRTSVADGSAVSSGRIAGLGDYGSGLMYPCTWLPDSSAVLFAFRRQGSAAPDGFGVYDFESASVTVIDGKKVLAGEGPVVQDCPGVSGDGVIVAYTAQRAGATDLLVAPADGGPATPFVVAAPLDAHGTPGYLETGSAVVALVVDDPAAVGGANNYDIAIVDRGGTIQNLTREGHYDFAPAVSPDQTSAAFLSTREGTLGVYTVPLEPDAPATLVATLEDEPGDLSVAALAWSPDGTRRIALTTGATAGARIYLVDPATGAVTNVGQRGRFGLAPNWFPDSSGIIF